MHTSLFLTDIGILSFRCRYLSSSPFICFSPLALPPFVSPLHILLFLCLVVCLLFSFSPISSVYLSAFYPPPLTSLSPHFIHPLTLSLFPRLHRSLTEFPAEHKATEFLVAHKAERFFDFWFLVSFWLILQYTQPSHIDGSVQFFLWDGQLGDVKALTWVNQSNKP